MATQKKPQVKKPVASKTVAVKKTATADTFDRLNSWLEKNDRRIFFTLLAISTLLSLLLFDSKVSTGGDDSAYIERAWQLLNDGIFPYFQGPGYPVFLSLFVKLFGLNVIILKLTSVACHAGFVWFTYKAFRKRIPYMVLFALLTFISFNSFFQYYASQTYTETFFLFVQAVCLYIMFNVIDSIKKDTGFVDGIKQNYMKWIGFGIMFVLLSLSKSIAFVTIGGVLAYLVLKGNFKEVIYAVVAFAVFRIIYQVAVTAAFGANDASQLELMMRKDIYKPNLGHEDFSGMITRFMKNFELYFSLHMYRIMNLRGFDEVKVKPPLATLSALVMGVITIISYKKNKYIFFTCLYLLVLCAGIFVGVQATNTQDRLILIAMPFIFLAFFYGAYELAKRAGVLQYGLILFSIVMLFITIGKSAEKAGHNTTALSKNLKGDIYYGYTPDWENFLRMSRYCGDSIPSGDSAQIISRKPEMSFIYGNGKKFIGQFWVTTMDADSVLMGWRAQKVKYVIMPSLRMEPKHNNGRIINTIQRMIQPIAMRYPQKLRLVKTIGTEEPTYLYEINY